MTIRIAQTELGQGVWTSNAMMVCEELQCDWTKVRPQYASANRDAREKAPEWTLNVMGQGATDPKGGGEPTFGNRDRTGVAGIPDSLYRRMRTNAASSVKDGRYYLQLAGAEARERLLLAAAALWNVPVAELTRQEQHHHARVERPHDDLRPDRPSCRRDAASASGDDHHQVAGPMDADGHRAEESRRAAQGDRQDGVRDRRPPARHEMGGREGVSRLWRRRQELRLRRDSHAAWRALRRAVPDSGSRADPRPRLQRRRRRHRRHLVPGQDRARSDADRVERFPPSTPRSTRRTCTRRCWPRSIGPAHVRVNQGDVDAAFARAARIVEATYSTPYLPRARMEPGNATVLVTSDRVDIWIGDQSPAGNAFQRREDHRHPRAERPSAPVPPGRRLRPQRQRSPGRAGDHDREREPRHPDPSALDARRGFHRHDVSRDGRGAPEGRSRCRRLADRARRAHGHAGRRVRPRRLVQRDLALPRAELSLLESHDEVPRARRHAARHRPGRARVLSRELHGRARPRRRQGSVSLSARAPRPHQSPLQGRHDQGARHGRRDVGLGNTAAAGQGTGHRASRNEARKATAWRRSAPWCIPSR